MKTLRSIYYRVLVHSTSSISDRNFSLLNSHKRCVGNDDSLNVYYKTEDNSRKP